MDPQGARVIRRMLKISEATRKAANKAIEAECHRMLSKLWNDQEKALLEMGAHRLAIWLREQRG